jgi:Holliday junction DNA helicase RuvA
MLYYIQGKLVEKTPTFLVVGHLGFAWQVKITLTTFASIQTLESAKLFTSLVVKSENQSVSGFDLYGFYTQSERDLFEKMISVSGVGANTARMMLSSFKPEEIIQAIATENEPLIQSIKGIGPKSAKRIILELKDKVTKLTNEGAISFTNLNNNQREEALNALVTLGFQKAAVEKVLSKLLVGDSSKSVETLIKEALKVL